MSTARERLSQSLEQLYRVFAHYPLPEHTDNCSCCHTEADDVLIHSKPLRELTSEDLGGYTSDSLLTWGDENLFRHFLPRIFELTFVSDNSQMLDEPLVMSRLRYGGWRNWPEEEQASLLHFMNLVWADHLESENLEGCPDWREPTENLLCALGNAHPDMSTFLQYWLEDERPGASRLLAAFILRSAILRDTYTGRDGFWGGCDEQYEQVRRWVRKEAVKRKLDRAAFIDPEASPLITAASSMLDSDFHF